MPWIEGVGDEVTITVSICLGICVLLAAWLSTGIRDIPLFSVIIVQLTRRQRAHLNDTPTVGDTGNVTETVTPAGGETLTPTSVQSQDDEGGSVDPLITVADGAHQLLQDLSDDSDDLEETNNEPEKVTESGTDSVQCNSSSTDNNLVPNVEQADSEEHRSNEQSGSVLENLLPSELRQRRLQFFSGNTKTCTDETDNSQHSGIPCNRDSDSEVLSENRLSDTGIESSTSHSVDNVTASEPNSNNADNVDTLTENIESVPINEPNDSTEEIRVRIKFLNDTQRLVTAPPNETIGNFRRRHFEEELSQSKLVRFIFNGQDLRNDSSTLQSYNVCDNSVLHCLVTQQPEQTEQHHGDENSFDIGYFMFPLFGLLLGIVWYMRITYRQFFNVTSTLTLGGITFLYLAALMSSLRGNRAHEHVE